MSLRISSVGDIMLGENVHHFGRGVASRYSGRFSELIAPEVLELINSRDLFFGNFECSLLTEAEWGGAGLERSMYAAPESALDVFNGVTTPIILNVANNHFGQHGKDAIKFSLTCLDQRGFYFIGVDPSPLVLNQQEQRVVAWGATLVKDLYGNDPGYFKSTPESLLDDIKWIEKRDGDIWVVSIHWGDEYFTCQGKSQEALAEQLFERGVDLILGHHPHVVQPTKCLHQGRVAFSHGNFIFDQNFSRLTQTGLLLLFDTGDSACRHYLLRMHLYRVDSIKEITEDWLRAYSRKKMSNFSPLRMRILMKLELLKHVWEVPFEVWSYFWGRLSKKVFGR